MIEINVSSKIIARQLIPSDATNLFELVDRNREHLRQFLPWLDRNTSVKDSETFIDHCLEIYRSNGAVTFGVFYEGKIVGMNGFHPIDKSNKIGAIGYWLDRDHCKLGITQLTTKSVIQYGFENLNLNRIEIRCATTNAGSNQVAKKLGFVLEGTLRQAEWLYDRYVDHNVYSLLKSEFI